MTKKIVITMLLCMAISIYAKSNNEGISTEDNKEITFLLNGEDTTVNVPKKPKSVVVIGYDTLDIIASLGYKDRVIGVVDPSGPLFPAYLEGYDEVASAGSLWGDDFEAIAGLKPDLIIASARTFSNLESLQEIAPTVYFTIPGMGSPFKDTLYGNIDLLAEIFTDKEKGDEIKSSLDDKFNEVKNRVSNLDDPAALFLIVTGKTIGLYSDDVKSRYGFVFNELGFDSPASMEEIEDNSAQHGNSVSFEFISEKNPNYMLIIDRGSGTGESNDTAQDTLENEIVAQTNAYKNGNLIYLDPTSWYISNGGVKSTFNMFDNLLSQIK